MIDVLYHYCSIETLELILKNKTFRFSSLGAVDDMEEALTSDFDDIGRICFVSCWTDLEQESVEMWRTYTGTNNGVRIGLPTNLFSFDLDEKGIPIPSNKIMKENDVSISPPYVPMLIPVTYTKDDELINLSVAKVDNESCRKCGNTVSDLNLQTKYLGRFKRDYWSGQSEWRYILIAVPQELFRLHQQGRYLKGNPEDMTQLMKSDLVNMTFDKDYIDFPFNELALNQIEIVLSPLNSEEDNKRTEELIKKYRVNSSTKKSSLKIRK